MPDPRSGSTSWVTLGKRLNFSEPLIPSLQVGVYDEG